MNININSNSNRDRNRSSNGNPNGNQKETYKTKVKLCGLSRPCDIEVVNQLQPDYIGFVFSPKSRRYVSYETAYELKRMLKHSIQAVGVFVNESPEIVAKLLNHDKIDIAQLHGNEDESYIQRLRELTDKPIIQSFQIQSEADVRMAQNSSADWILLDSGAGTGTAFDWKLMQDMQNEHSLKRPYFLAGGLNTANVVDAVAMLHPYAVDVSSGIETDGYKDKRKMEDFVLSVRM